MAAVFPVPGMRLDPGQTPPHLGHRQRTMWLRRATRLTAPGVVRFSFSLAIGWIGKYQGHSEP